MPPQTQVATTVDFEKAGKEQGYLFVPHSSNTTAWGNIQIPITVINNGPGSSILVLGGNHGDEVEGPVALMKLARELKLGDIAGRVIIIPALNLPAVRAGTRLSPIDGVNLNRAFPGKYNDSVTGLIAHYVSHVLFPLVDVVVDIHSGGRSLVFLPCAHLHRVADEQLFQRMLAAAKVWGGKYVLLYTDIAGEGLLPTTAEEMGKLVITTEMGGAGECNPHVLRTTENGIRNVLLHVGLLSGASNPVPTDVQVIASTQRQDYHLAPSDGIWESFFEVGDMVEKEEPLGQMHFPERFDRNPEIVIAQTSGVLICRRFPAHTSQGDCVGVVARPIEM